MTTEEYIKRLGFHFYGPHSPCRTYKTLRWMTRGLRWPLEVMNTKLPTGQSAAAEKLAPLLSVRKMSTFAIAAIINRIVTEMSPAYAFVNVGVWNGYTLLAGMLGNEDKTCVGVDNFSEFGGPRDAFLGNFEKLRSRKHAFHEMDYGAYFASVHSGTMGFYIYDAAHDYENQLKGLQAAEPFFSEDCFVLVDDTNWDEPHQATLEFMEESSNTYELLLDVKTSRNCHPTFWNGIMVFRRRKRI